MRIMLAMIVAGSSLSIACGCANLQARSAKAKTAKTGAASDATAGVPKKQSAQMVRDFEAKRDQTQLQAARSRWSQGDGEGCSVLLGKLLMRSPGHREAILLLAEVHLVEEMSAEALPAVKKFVEANPRDAAAQHAFGLLLQAAGDEAAGHEHLAIAAQLEPENRLYAAVVAASSDDDENLTRPPALVAKKPR